MADNQRSNQRFAPEWDSEDTSSLDKDFDEQGVARDTETGAVIGVIGGAVVGAIAGGPVGAVIGGVIGGVASGASVAAIERHEHEGADTDRDVDDDDLDAVNRTGTRTSTSAQNIDSPFYGNAQTRNDYAPVDNLETAAYPSEAVTGTVEPAQNTRTPNPMSSPYPGDAGRPEAVQLNGVGIFDAPAAGESAPNRYAVSDYASGTAAADISEGQTGTFTGSPVTLGQNTAQELSTSVDDEGRATFLVAGYPEARQVAVIGSFNDWSETANPLQFQNGAWSTQLSLAPGKYLYRYIIDGQSITDPNNPASVQDGQGNVNSVLTVERDVVNPGSILGSANTETSTNTI